ncbi:MAG: hypothetical protein HQK77_03535 [Desulfobacterales bacterium]|nr:hypothetical protein [Desulfobacterales bacterium]
MKQQPVSERSNTSTISEKKKVTSLLSGVVKRDALSIKKGMGIWLTDPTKCVHIERNTVQVIDVSSVTQNQKRVCSLVFPIGEIFHEFDHIPLKQFEASNPINIRQTYVRRFRQSGEKRDWQVAIRYLGNEFRQDQLARLMIMKAFKRVLHDKISPYETNQYQIEGVYSILVALLPFAEKTALPDKQSVVLIPIISDNTDSCIVAVFFFNNGFFWFGRVTPTGIIQNQDDAMEFVNRILQTTRAAGLDSQEDTHWLLLTDNQNWITILEKYEKVKIVNQPLFFPLQQVPSSLWPAAGAAYIMATEKIRIYDHISYGDHYPKLYKTNYVQQRILKWQRVIEASFLFVLILALGTYAVLYWMKKNQTLIDLQVLKGKTNIVTLKKQFEEKQKQFESLKDRMDLPVLFEQEQHSPWGDILNKIVSVLPEDTYLQNLSLKRNPKENDLSWIVKMEGQVVKKYNKQHELVIDQLEKQVESLVEQKFFKQLISLKRISGEDSVTISKKNLQGSQSEILGFELMAVLNTNVSFQENESKSP